MPVSINMPGQRQQEQPLDKLMTALNIAKTVYGIHTDSQQLEIARQKAQTEASVMADESKKRGLEIDKLQTDKTNSAELNNPNSKLMETVRAAAKAKGLSIPEGTTPAQAKTMFDDFLKPKKETDPMAEELAQARLDAAKSKAEDLSSNQGKQRGLYEMGLKAEKQYQDATQGTDYNPTVSGQIIDNSQWAPNFLKNNNAIKAQAAQAAWVEAFLRDASGAAIPPGERAEYAQDFFPQPGDPEDVVTNKTELRNQKMENARIAAGSKANLGAPAQADGGQVPKDIQAQAKAILEKRRKDARR